MSRKESPKPRSPDHPIADHPIPRILLGWFDREKRSLPWRRTLEPYHIWVAEVMLQQTTVGAVASRYEAFLERFPTVAKLARSPEEQVLAAWSGLGYYARARNLRRAAQRVVREHEGRLPSNFGALRRLPGFGDYTAAAVASIAFGARLPAADANVTRVLSRLFAIEGPAGSKAHRAAVLRRAAELLPRERPGDFTAALMDLGQLLCTPRRPACPRCPLARSCAARATGRPDRFPRRRPKPAPVEVCLAAADARDRGRTLLVRQRGRLLSGLWAYPSAEGRTQAEARRRLAARLADVGLRLAALRGTGSARHTIVNRRLDISVYPASFQSPITNHKPPIPQSRWFGAEALSRAAIPTLTRKIAIAAGFLR